MQWMGLPLVLRLLQSAVATGLPVRRSFSEGGWSVLSQAGIVAKRPAGPWLQGTVAGQTSLLFTMQQVTVRVPGSTSNLGPGFDCLGVALRIHNSVTVIRASSGEAAHPRIVSEAADRFFKQARCRAFSFSCSIAEQLPRSRGLGSSATVRLGILLALNHLIGEPLDRLTVFQLCAELEGHPDNAAPATFGGFTVVQSSASVSLARGKRDVCPAVYRFDVAPRLYFVFLVPELEIQTARA